MSFMISVFCDIRRLPLSFSYIIYACRLCPLLLGAVYCIFACISIHISFFSFLIREKIISRVILDASTVFQVEISSQLLGIVLEI